MNYYKKQTNSIFLQFRRVIIGLTKAVVFYTNSYTNTLFNS
jgi:hypothetical protein